MRRVVTVLFLLALSVLLPGAARAEETGEDALFREQYEASGAEALFDELPEETRQLLERLGIHGADVEGLEALQPDGVWNGLLSLFAEQTGGVLKTGGVVLGIVLLCALAEGMKQTVKEPALAEVFGVVGSLAACGAVMLPVANCVVGVCRAAESASVFMLSYVPVYAGVLASTGQVTLALSYQTVVLFAAELIAMLVIHVVLPLLTISLAFGVTGSVTSGVRLDGAGGLLNKSAVWLLGIVTTLFVGLLSLQGIVGAAADTLGSKAVRLSLSSFVPVVGGALSEAFGTVQGCLKLLKSTLGVFGIGATGLIVLPPLLQCAGWSICLSVCGMAAEMFELGPLAALLKNAQGVVKTLIGVLASCALFLIIATTIVTTAGG